jgi:undecaprenyl-diphosphatase
MAGGSWDEQIMSFVADHRSPALNHMARAVMDAGNSPRVAAVGGLVVLALVLWRGWYRPALAALAALCAGAVVADLLKLMFDRPRPPPDLSIVSLRGSAFPSTHAAATSAVAAAILLSVVWRTRALRTFAATVLALLVMFIGACMVYLGGLWASDVLVGWAIGIVLGCWIGWLARPRTRQWVAEEATAEHAR